MKTKKICAVVITFNRKSYLAKLLRALENQNYLLDAIFVYDNNSTDGTMELLLGKTVEKNELIKEVRGDHNYYFYFNSENSGGSGGFSNAIRLASEWEFEYLWCMDDDVMPDKGCLMELQSHISENAKICIPSRTDDNYRDFAVTHVNMSNPFKYSIASRKTMVPNESIATNSIDVVDMPFEGPLIETNLIAEIGFPREDFFIIFDDSEYAARACKITKIKYCKNAVLHKQIIPKADKKKLMNWKNYYGYRNQIWFDRHYGKNWFVKFMRPRLLLADLTLRAVVLRKYSNIRVIYRAYSDGIHDRLGKLVEPGTDGKNI